MDVIAVYRGFAIIRISDDSYKAAGAYHGSYWSAQCYIDELLSK